MSSQDEFWKNIGLLVAIDCKRSDRDLKIEVNDWAEKLITKKKSVQDGGDREKEYPLHFEDDSYSECSTDLNEEVRKFLASLDLPPIECKFSHPLVRSKLEKLMGSGMVSLTDRKYMIDLQEKILQDYSRSMTSRIIERQATEMERVKNLVLSGKIPLEQAPIEMANHPVMLINEYVKKLLIEKRAKIKVLKPFIPKYVYWDDTPDPPSGLSIESGHCLRQNNDRLCVPPDLFLVIDDKEQIADGYMYNDQEYEAWDYESPLILELQQCESVEDMYRLADKIIGFMEEEDEEEGEEAPEAPTAD